MLFKIIPIVLLTAVLVPGTSPAKEPPPVYDMVVVGAGVVGSATAYSLAKRSREKILVLEQISDPARAFGSSTGESRITRKISIENPEYMSLNRKSVEILSELAKKTGTELIRNKDFLTISAASGQSQFDLIRKEAERSGISHKFYANRQEILRDHPTIKLPATGTYIALKEFGGGGTGVMHAHKIIAALRSQARALGASFHYGERLENLQKSGPLLTLRTDQREYRARRVILTTGFWTSEFLGLPLRPVPNVLYYKKMTAAEEAGLPIMIVHDSATRHHFYSLPEGQDLKIAFHMLDPDVQNPGPEAIRSVLSKFYRFSDTVTDRVGTCFYTITPDKKPIIGPVAGWNGQLMVGAAFQGNGFKMAAGIGDLLATYALGEKPAYNYEAFSPDRFTVPKGQKNVAKETSLLPKKISAI